MINWLLQAVAGILATVAMGVIANAIWEWLRDTISVTSANFIDIRGEWTVASSYELTDGSNHEYQERLIIRQQFLRRFRGTIYSPHPANTEEIVELDVRGEFKDKFHVVFLYDHRSSKLADVGAGVLQVNADHTTAEGASVNFGVSSPTKPAIIKFTIQKVSA